MDLTLNVVEFHHIKSQFTENTFLMSVSKWINRTGAVGISAKSGRYGGTYAHNEIAIYQMQVLVNASVLSDLKD